MAGVKQNRNSQFSKTKMCRFELLGICAKGLQCPFAHGSTELRALPDLRNTKLCRELLQTGECNNRNCTYAHNREELRSTLERSAPPHRARRARGDLREARRSEQGQSYAVGQDAKAFGSSAAAPAPAFWVPPGLEGEADVTHATGTWAGFASSQAERDWLDRDALAPFGGGGSRALAAAAYGLAPDAPVVATAKGATAKGAVPSTRLTTDASTGAASSKSLGLPARQQPGAPAYVTLRPTPGVSGRGLLTSTPASGSTDTPGSPSSGAWGDAGGYPQPANKTEASPNLLSRELFGVQDELGDAHTLGGLGSSADDTFGGFGPPLGWMLPQGVCSVNQQDNMWQVRSLSSSAFAAKAPMPRPIHPVRTSESTLCTLGDQDRSDRF